MMSVRSSLWWNTALARLPSSQTIVTAIHAALEAVDPYTVVQQYVELAPDYVRLGTRMIPIEGRLFVLAAGKAAVPMTQALLDQASASISAGVVVAKRGHVKPNSLAPLQVYEADHPVPTASCVVAAQAFEVLAHQVHSEDLVLLLLSGGASALLANPLPPLSLTDLQQTTNVLLHAGVPIKAINTVRKHCETLKGGRLAALLKGQIETLIISDVINSPLDVIASGPTAPDPTTFAEAVALVEPWREQIRVYDFLVEGTRGLWPETPKPGDLCFAQVRHTILAENRHALQAAAQVFNQADWHVEVDPTPFNGEAQSLGVHFAQRLLDSQAPRPSVLLAGGESTVTVVDSQLAYGRGGRNQELALAAAQVLAGHDSVALLALATDGEDGSSPAAGAVAVGATIEQARQAGFDIVQILAEHRSYDLWKALVAAFEPGPTQTNVQDLIIGVRV